MIDRRIIVRVLFSRDRATAAEHELAALAGCQSFRQGTAPESCWDFTNLEAAQVFQINAANTPGVSRIDIG